MATITRYSKGTLLKSYALSNQEIEIKATVNKNNKLVTLFALDDGIAIQAQMKDIEKAIANAKAKGWEGNKND